MDNKVENKFKSWFYSLSVTENRRAKKELIEQLEIPYSTLYYWLKDDYIFARIQMVALNDFALKFNGTKIF